MMPKKFALIPDDRLLLTISHLEARIGKGNEIKKKREREREFWVIILIIVEQVKHSLYRVITQFY